MMELCSPLSLFEHLLTSSMGWSVQLRRHRVQKSLAGFHVVTAEVRDVDADAPHLLCAGGSFTFSKAFHAACGEAIERMALTRRGGMQTVRACSRDLVGDYVPPDRFVYYPSSVYTEAPFPLRRYHPNDEIEWMYGYDMTRRSPIWVPLGVVLSRYTSAHADAPFEYPVSTGGASGFSFEEAYERGLYEVIERDAFMVHWENRWPAFSMPPTGFEKQVALVLRRAGWRLHVRRCASDMGVPVALAFVEDETNQRVAVGMGAAARLTWEDAVEKAIEEAVLSIFWLRSEVELGRIPAYEQIWQTMHNVPEPSLHAFLYRYHQMREQASFLWKESAIWPEDKSPAPPKSFHELVMRLAHAGYQIIVVACTPEELSLCGVVVVRVLIPGFIPLSRGLYLRPLQNPRLRMVPTWFGYPHRADVGFHPVPHLFP
nr:YcaO-like family protein [Ardenticatena sp.]